MNRLPSYGNLLSLDHTLQAVLNDGLKLFTPDEEKDDARPLLDLPALVLQSDQGSDMVAPVYFALHHLKLRLAFIPDVRHQLVRVMANACKAAKLQVQVALSDIILTVLQGPWSDHKWWQVVREQTEEYLKMARMDGDPCHALLRKLMPAIGREQGLGRMDVHVQNVHESLADATFLVRKGVNNTSRWDSFHGGFQERKSEFSLLLLILLVYGLRLGYVKSDTLSDLTPLAKTANASAQDDVPLRNANAEKQNIKNALYARCRNKLHVATVILANSQVMSDLHLWYWASSPVRNALNRCRKDIKGRAHTLDHLMNLATGGGLRIINELADVCHNAEALRDVGILQQDDLAGVARYTCPGENFEVRRQDDIMERMLWTVLCLVHHMMLDLGHHMFGWPLRFAALLDPAHEAECLQEMKDVWAAWEDAQKMPGQAWTAIRKRSLLGTTFCRDVFFRVQRDGWILTSETRQFLQQCLSCWGSTYNEEAFGELRQLEQREGKVHHMSHAEVWSSASAGQVMTRFGYREVVGDASVLAPDLPDGLFHTRAKTASIPKIRDITGRATWPSLKPLDAARLPAEVQSMRILHASKRMQDVTMTWRTSFLCRGMVLRQTSKKKDYKLCTGVWPHGASALLLPLERYELKKGTFAFRIQKPLSRDKLSWGHVFQFADWEVMRARVVSPLHLGHACSSKGAFSVPFGEGPWIEEDKTGVPLLKYCAMNGFFDTDAKSLELLLEAGTG